MNQQILRKTFILSFMLHCFVLGFTNINFNQDIEPKQKELTLDIDIKKPDLLPKIEKLSEERKLKEIKTVEKEIKKTKPLPEVKKEIITENIPIPEKDFVEDKIEQEKIKVTNPQDQAMLRYQDMIKRKIQEFRKYPNWAKEQGYEGVVNISFIVLADGTVKDVAISLPCEFNILNKAAVSTVSRAAPFMPIPKEIVSSSVEIQLSIVFKLWGQTRKTENS